MDHFSVIQSIIRSGLAGDQAGLGKQVQRLLARLEKAGQEKEAATVRRLLSSSIETKELKPSKVEVLRSMIHGKTLTPDTIPPIDRETGAQLCTVEFPGAMRTAPIYERDVKDTIDGLLDEWRHPEALRCVDVDPTRSLLIFGPPGSGKTMTAYHIAQNLELPLVMARIDGLISSFLGTTARNIANLFEFANRYACVLLLDEFDALAKQRDDPQEIGEIKRVVNTLLQNLDLRRDHGVTIAITNHDRLLDPAVWRRFETHVHIGEPNLEASTSLVKRFLLPIIPDNGTVGIIAYCLEGRSGADLQRVCTSIKRTLALSGAKHDGPGVFQALSTVLARLPSHDHVPAKLLASDPEAFVSLMTNDSHIAISQQDIAAATGMSKSKISDLKKSKRHLPLVEASHAK